MSREPEAPTHAEKDRPTDARAARYASHVRVRMVGMGYVGLPLAVAFAEAGIEVTGVDLDDHKVAALVRAESYIEDIESPRLQALGGRIHATARYADLAKVDAIVVCVPTPLTANREPDLATAQCDPFGGERAPARSLVVIESTTYPGTTRERLVPLLEESGLAAGRDFFVAFSPERVDPGRNTLRTTPKVVAGVTPACLERAQELYGHVCNTLVPVSSSDAAELTKLLENIFGSADGHGIIRSPPSSSSSRARSTRTCPISAWRRSLEGSTTIPSRSGALASRFSEPRTSRVAATCGSLRPLRSCACCGSRAPGLDLQAVAQAPLVVDLRGVTRGLESPNLVRL